MKTCSVLALSVAVNLVLAGTSVFYASSAREARAGLHASVGKGATPGADYRHDAGEDLGAGLSAKTRELLAESGAGNLEALRDRLLAEGLPRDVVKMVISARAWAERKARFDADDPVKKRPWWQQTQEQLPGDEIRRNRQWGLMTEAVKAELAQLFPDEAVHELSPKTAFLPAKKREEVQALMDDYDELQAKLYRDAGGSISMRVDREKDNFLTAEKERDLRALLTPAEYEEMRLRALDTHADLRREAAVLNFTEKEFRGILEIESWLGREMSRLPQQKDPFAAQPPEVQQAWEALQVEEKRRKLELLGAERVDRYGISNGEYEQVARTIARYDLPESKVEEYFSLDRKLQERGKALIEAAHASGNYKEALESFADESESSFRKLMDGGEIEELPIHQHLKMFRLMLMDPGIGEKLKHDMKQSSTP